jgi:hypothetical protein
MAVLAEIDIALIIIASTERLCGGGGSLKRTLLCSKFPDNREKHREFACFDGSNYALFLGDPHPKPISGPSHQFSVQIGTGNEQERIRERTGTHQGIVF